MTTVVLALVSALFYGLSDFVGGIASRRTSAWAVAVVGNAASAVGATVLALVAAGSPTPTDLAWGVFAGIGGGMGTGFLYRGFSTGRMSVVAPVSAVGAAVIPVLAGVVSGERPSLVVWAGIAVALPGIWLVSSSPEHPATGMGRATGRSGLPEGLVDAILAGIGFGLLFAALGQVPARAGLWPVVASQAVSVPAVIVLALVLGGSWVPRGKPVRLGVLTGLLGVGATATFLLSTQHGFLTVAAVLASLYPATTVLLAWLVLREHIHRSQALGLALCALAIVLVAGG